MKKHQSIFCIALLSTLLVGNVFAGTTVGPSVFGILDNVIGAVVELMRGDSCPLRQCQNCRPTEEGDGNGNCRPKED